MTLRLASWGIILDDIVFPDGRTAMRRLGGGGLYAAVGMRLWTRDAGIIAATGTDFERESLLPLGLDTSGVFTTEWPTPRAWQLFEEDGTRTQIPRVSPEAWERQIVLLPSPQTIPATLEAAHYLTRGHPAEEEMLAALAEAGVRLSGEPIVDPAVTEEERLRILRNLARLEIFSPGEPDAAFLAGPGPVADQLRSLADRGPRIVAIRRGAAGSVVYERDRDRFWVVPAAPANLVDVTGAGNAYCGGMLAGWMEAEEITHAAACAAVSAAIALEQIGPPAINPAVEVAARERHAAVRAAIRAFEA